MFLDKIDGQKGTVSSFGCLKAPQTHPKANSWMSPHKPDFLYSPSQWRYCVPSGNLIVTLEKFSPWPRGQYITKTCQFYIEIALHTCKVSFHCCWQSRVSLVVSLLKYTFYLWLLLRSSVGLCWSTVSLNESRYRFIFGILLGNAGLHEYLDWSFSSLQMLPLTHSLTLVTTLLCC